MTEHVTVCDQAYDPSTTPKYDLHSVSSLTTYQLRQELVRLGAFERFFPPERVQYCCYAQSRSERSWSLRRQPLRNPRDSVRSRDPLTPWHFHKNCVFGHYGAARTMQKKRVAVGGAAGQNSS